MKNLYIYEPALCCATGLCGVSIDPELLRITTVLNTLKERGVAVRRYNLNDAPMEFVKCNRAWKYYKQIMPNKVIQKVGVERYHAEAYAYCSTMLGKDNEKFGWGCVSQVTGTAAWMDVVATQYLLGIRPTLKGLLIDPSIPDEWDGFTVERTYRGCKLTIMVDNPDHIQHGVKEIRVDGKRIDRENVPLLTDIILSGRTNASIQVTMGS